MQKILYGKTNEYVTPLGMGGMRFPKEMSDDKAKDLVRKASEMGISYFDTAPAYCDDRSESIYGKALQKMPNDEWTIATKGFNTKNGNEIFGAIENSLRKLKLDTIDFYFLWCITNIKQYEKSKMKGQAIEGILKAKEKGYLKHIGVSTHVYSEDIKTILDDDIFEFIMIPYNILNFREREEGAKYAKEKGLGVAAMNPLYGGVIANAKNALNIEANENKNAIEKAMAFCLESPYIDITLSGMNSIDQIKENVSYGEKYSKISETFHKEKVHKTKATMKDMCTSCGYCMSECPKNINIKSYMEVYNSLLISNDKDVINERHYWYTHYGPLSTSKEKAIDCIECQACEEACTQFLPIVERLKWISENIEK